MNQEFEIISHSQMNFKLFLVNMLYRTPHIHKDFELCLLLEGRLSLQAQNENHSLKPNLIKMRRAFKPALCRPSGHPAQQAFV